MLSLGHVEDTSLALPSDRHMRSAQQRVLEQVYTVKRRKSRYSSKSASGPTSPTSPGSDSVFSYNYKRLAASALSGSSMNRSTMTNQAKQRQSFFHKSTHSRLSNAQMSMSPRKQRLLIPPTITVSAHLQPNSMYRGVVSQSAPEVGLKPTANGSTAQRNQTSAHSSQWMEKMFYYPSQPHANGNVGRIVNTGQGGSTQHVKRQVSSVQSNGESRMSVSKTGQAEVSGLNKEGLIIDMTMKEAVEYLLSEDKKHQLHGAAYIQHSTFTDDKAKQEVLTLKGITPLINLLNSPSPQVQETVAAALRNSVFKNQPNKDEVHRSGGIPPVVQLLNSSETNTETQKHLTGLLWNLSSADNIKLDLLHFALPALNEKVINPFSASAGNTTNTSIAPEVFCNATACLRNLSSSKLLNRTTMRKCSGLIDSLMRYMENCINAETFKEQSLENCLCILQNLTYQLQTEMPELFIKIYSLAPKPPSTSVTGPISCFSAQSQKLQHQSGFDYPVMEENSPKGAVWLFHSKALQMYLKLLSSSESDVVQEASCGALRNLTTNDSIVSSVLSDTIIQKLKGLTHISPLLESHSLTLQNGTVSLLGNLSRSAHTHKNMAHQCLQGLVVFLNSRLTGSDTSPQFDNLMATALHCTHVLLNAQPDMRKMLINPMLIQNLNHMSQNRFLLKSSTAAGGLLHSLWSDRNIQNVLKKQGMNKKIFVNDITSAAFKSLQVVD